MKLCIYGASGERLDARYFEAARDFGRLLGQHGHSLIFGGGAHGLMGACAEGAAETGAEIIGVAPRFFDEPGVLFPRCTRFVWTDTMRERKAIMEEESEAFLVLPGGIGTLEEFFETLTLKQLGLHGKPIALLNTLGYYDALRQLLEQAAASPGRCFWWPPTTPSSPPPPPSSATGSPKTSAGTNTSSPASTCS